ncbi:DNA-directed DNA polymerase [Aureococcus anophagefferens]|nr:DNA-directed DNA polymerase [Aureococcus anophagefferens]
MAERPPNDASRIASVATSLFAHAAAKGGQEGLDREKVNNIIFELSGSSSYTKEKLEHRGDAEKWVAAARRKLETFDGTKRSVAAHHLKKREAALEATRRAMDAAGTVCCVVDFDMFYAAVELRDRPELKDKPVAVGGPGMITTANYVARKWGVRSAMPGFIGQELCRRGPEFGMPRAELVFVRPDFEKYTAVSKVARAIFAEYDPHLACYSLDEAYLDLTLYLRARAAAGSHGEATKLLATPRPRKRKRGAGFGEPDDDDDEAPDDDDEADGVGDDGAAAPAVALPPLDLRDDAAGRLADAVLAEIRVRVRAATGGLTLSGGLGPNFRLAKVAADVRKPDGQHRVACGRPGVLAFRRSLPCRKVGGVGRVLEQKLEDGLGVRTCGELLDRLPEVHALFAPKGRDFLQDVGLGVGAAGGPEDDDDEDGLPKGLGNERTFRPVSGLGPLLAKLEAIAAIVAARLETRGMPREAR